MFCQVAWWKFVENNRTSKCSTTVILELFMIIALFYCENYCSAKVSLHKLAIVCRLKQQPQLLLFEKIIVHIH